MMNLIMYKDGESSWVRYIRKRIKSNLNFLAIATGPTGVGKSWAMLSLAHMIDPEFDAKQIAFSFKGVMELINADWFKKKKWKIILFDEPQIEISNRAWQSLTNSLFNYLLSTFRHQNVILLFATPYADFIDIQSHKLLHCEFEVKSHSLKTNTTKLRPKLLQYNSKMKKFYYHSLGVIRNGMVNKMVSWNIPKPPKHLVAPYELMKNEFTSKLNKKIEDKLRELEEDKDERRPLTDNQKGYYDYHLQGWSNLKIADYYKVHPSLISRQLISVFKKKYPKFKKTQIEKVKK